ncbi:molybdenum cofactor guanylyltransferase, partial [Angustibacter aerolatus]
MSGEPDVEGLIGVVVPAGGRSSRFGGDKLAAPFGDGTVLDHLLRRLGRLGVPVRLVGPEVPGGPVPAIAAGLTALPGPDDALVAVVAGDQPFAADALPLLVAALRAAPQQEAAVGVDAGGRDQPLLA